MVSHIPPMLPVLVRGQQIRNGPYSVTVTEQMVRDRERANEKLARRWQREQERRRHLTEGLDEYFGEFREKKVRRRFLRRVFSILTLQLMFTASLIAAFLFVEDVREAVTRNPLWLILALGVFIFTYVSIGCCDFARHGACGAVYLVLLTLSLAYIAASMSAMYSTEAVMLAAGSTALVTLTITCIATCTNFDLTKYSGFVVIVLVVGFISMSIAMLMMFAGFHVSTAHLAIAIIGTLLMSMFLFYDVQAIMGGRVVAVEPDEVIFATTQLFVDIILLYQYILMLFGIANQ